MDNEGFILRIRGLPWQATREEVANFFAGCQIRNGVNGIFMTLSREGRPSGEAYVEMETEDDYKRGLECNRKHLGPRYNRRDCFHLDRQNFVFVGFIQFFYRYIEVFPSKRSEMEWMTRRQGIDSESHHQEDAYLRLRGLPFSATRDDILKFFTGLDVVADGIVLPTDHHGRSSGEAYVQFGSRDSAEQAMGKHKEKIGHRYIEIFKSSFQEFRSMKNYMEQKPFPTGYGHVPYGPSHDSMPPNSYTYHKMRLGHPQRPAPYPDRFRGGPYYSGGYVVPGASRGPPPGTSRRLPYGDFDDGFRGRPPPYASRNPYDQFPNSSHNHSDNSYGGHTVHMRGLPYKTNEGEIYEFFLPLHPVSVRILYDDLGRASGEADVEFATHEDAVKAMNKDKAYIQKRYIELFLHSSPSPMGRSPSFNERTHPRYGNPPLANMTNNGANQMGGWESSMVMDDVIRSRAKLE